MVECIEHEAIDEIIAMIFCVRHNIRNPSGFMDGIFKYSLRKIKYVIKTEMKSSICKFSIMKSCKKTSYV